MLDAEEDNSSEDENDLLASKPQVEEASDSELYQDATERPNGAVATEE